MRCARYCWIDSIVITAACVDALFICRPLLLQVMGHKAGWMDSIGSANFSAIEDILHKYNADLYLTGREYMLL